ncbi:sigma-70 family RNA polymerase sigma factor [Thermoactinospora rubra]|uniref:sigma-70 family RNA polymerase sigma factor n=1 Tax=Thermoactinospora rubra TaxID=1088767 RepID=UPI000A1124D2|nr:sigma-70 family RNA polymerase sigma factor [Thermoactinospora rubra]
MNDPSSTLGYEAEKTDVDAIVSDVLASLDDITDLGERYHRLTAEQALYEAVVRRLAELREETVARLNIGDGTGRRAGRMSYEQIAQVIGKSRAAAQQMVERGRARL